MHKPDELEAAFHQFSKDLGRWLPDGIIQVDLALLESQNLLHCPDFGEESPDNLSQHFHVVEADDKVTLFNEKFIVWVVPQVVNDQSETLVIIAKNQPSLPRIELAFTTAGVYNTSRIVLKVLEHLLMEIIENDEMLGRISKTR